MYVYGFSISGVFDDKSEGCVGEKVGGYSLWVLCIRSIQYVSVMGWELIIPRYEIKVKACFEKSFHQI